MGTAGQVRFLPQKRDFSCHQYSSLPSPSLSLTLPLLFSWQNSRDYRGSDTKNQESTLTMEMFGKTGCYLNKICGCHLHCRFHEQYRRYLLFHIRIVNAKVSHLANAVDVSDLNNKSVCKQRLRACKYISTLHAALRQIPEDRGSRRVSSALFWLNTRVPDILTLVF